MGHNFGLIKAFPGDQFEEKRDVSREEFAENEFGCRNPFGAISHHD